MTWVENVIWHIGVFVVFRGKEPLKDSVVSTYEEHEDSVYAAEWSSADPWLFASLSYDGRLVINRVPRALKYRILLWDSARWIDRLYASHFMTCGGPAGFQTLKGVTLEFKHIHNLSCLHLGHIVLEISISVQLSLGLSVVLTTELGEATLKRLKIVHDRCT